MATKIQEKLLETTIILFVKIEAVYPPFYFLKEVKKMELTVKNQKIEIKFTYQLMYKVNKQLGTVNEKTGRRNSDGVGTLFYQVVEGDDQALVDLVKLCSGKKSLSEDDVLDAIAAHVEEKGDTEELFTELKDEMVASGFFKEKISKYIGNMEKTVKILESNPDTSEAEIQVVQEMIGTLKSALS